MGHRLEVAGSSVAAILGFAQDLAGARLPVESSGDGGDANLCTAQLAAVR